jgi:hypothetical protein
MLNLIGTNAADSGMIKLAEELSTVLYQSLLYSTVQYCTVLYCVARARARASNTGEEKCMHMEKRNVQ